MDVIVCSLFICSRGRCAWNQRPHADRDRKEIAATPSTYVEKENPKRATLRAS